MFVSVLKCNCTFELQSNSSAEMFHLSVYFRTIGWVFVKLLVLVNLNLTCLHISHFVLSNIKSLLYQWKGK